jgi:HEAT repeat protein
MKTTFIITWVAAIALSGCSDNRPEVDGRSDDDVVEGMRIFYPGGEGFSEYSSRVIIRGAGIVPELIAASRDTDSKMRESAARCLGQIATDEAVTRLIEMTSDEEIEEGIWIALSYAASSRAIPVLQAELSSRSDPRSRGRLLMTLVECGDTSQLPDLLEYMKTSSLPGHIYHANLVFEKLAGRRFNKDTKKIEEWLRERNAEVEAFQEAAAANHSESVSPAIPDDLRRDNLP